MQTQNTTTTDDSVRQLFVIGEVFPIEVRRVTRRQLVDMIQLFCASHPNLLSTSFETLEVEALTPINLLDLAHVFAGATVRLNEQAETGDPMTASRMAVTIFAQLFMFAVDLKYLNLHDYNGAILMARRRVKHWELMTSDVRNGN